MSPRPFFQTFNEHNKQNMNQDIFNQEEKKKTRSYLTIILNFENYLKLLIVAQKCLTDRKCSQTNKTGLAQCGHSKLGSKILILTYFIIFYTCRHEKKNVLSAGGNCFYTTNIHDWQQNFLILYQTVLLGLKIARSLHGQPQKDSSLEPRIILKKKKKLAL